MTHLHITTWVVALILLFVSYSLYSSGSAKGAKITHMILRLFYILIILTGAELFVSFANWNGEYAGKMILGIITVGLMEMLLIRKKKEKSTGGLWIGFVIVLLLTVLLGLHLPIGFQLI
ncbi:YisL family protein [Bacillus subtilis subsp. subtilis]|nr:YisL family protein [Bacillus subtilis]MEC0323474.1 YisL family protein [Bacillus subtilis]